MTPDYRVDLKYLFRERRWYQDVDWFNVFVYACTGLLLTAWARLLWLFFVWVWKAVEVLRGVVQ